MRKFSYVRFEPEGMTSNPEIPFSKSMPDYIMRWLASRFLDADLQEELGILTKEVRAVRRPRTRPARHGRHVDPELSRSPQHPRRRKLDGRPPRR